MNQELLSKEYQKTFVDNEKYSNHVAPVLTCLAQAIENSHKSWRPTVSELVKLLPESEDTNKLIAAGRAYGTAKQVMTSYPGLAILLFGAALNVIGECPKTELKKTIEEAKKKIKEKGLDSNVISVTIKAAEYYAKFDKVAQILRDEFTNGLKDSKKYTDVKIKEVVPKIVKVTHDVRHRALVERSHWKIAGTENGGSSTDMGYIHKIDDVIFEEDSLKELLEYAQIGCAFSILRRLLDRKRNYEQIKNLKQGKIYTIEDTKTSSLVE